MKNILLLTAGIGLQLCFYKKDDYDKYLGPEFKFFRQNLNWFLMKLHKILVKFNKYCVARSQKSITEKS